MKFIHCADLHLDSRMETNLSPQKARERKLEILGTFERMVTYARNHGVRGIIIAGDMFDTARIAKATKERVLHTIIKNPEIDFLYLSGNHDETNFITLISEVPPNLKIFTTDWQTFAYGNLKITGRIFEAHNQVNFYHTLNLTANDYNIVVLHGELGRQGINLEALKNKNIDYLALGHIHSYSQAKLDARGVYCYSGCLEGRGFDECGPKGFVLLDVDPDKHTLQSQFVGFAARELCEVNCNITGYDDWFALEERIITLVNDIPRRNLLKITLTGKYHLKLDKQLAMLAKRLDDFFYVKLKDDSVLDVTLKDVENDISLRGEFMRRVLRANLDDKLKEQTILFGLKALDGERWWWN